MPPSLVLASTSPIRRKLLTDAGLSFASRSPLVDEAAIKRAHPDLAPDLLALRLAEAKALAILEPNPYTIVIAADQILALEATTFDKPDSITAARSQLTTLRGKTHSLLSAVTCAQDNKIIWRHVAQAHLTMRNFTGVFLDEYIAACQNGIVTSVGAYKLEERGIQLFDRIDGDYFTILGLPLLPLLQFLRTQGAAQS